MPSPGKKWRMVTFGTHNSWRPGDERGWRSRGHRRHSSGDYKEPPPPDEHEGLRRWVNAHANEPVTIPLALRKRFADAIALSLLDAGHRVLAVSVSGQHCHIVVELPDHYSTMKAIIGDAKRISSKCVRKEMPGRIWAAGADFEPIESRDHLEAATNYVLRKQGPGARVWSFRDCRARPGAAR